MYRKRFAGTAILMFRIFFKNITSHFIMFILHFIISVCFLSLKHIVYNILDQNLLIQLLKCFGMDNVTNYKIKKTFLMKDSTCVWKKSIYFNKFVCYKIVKGRYHRKVQKSVNCNILPTLKVLINTSYFTSNVWNYRTKLS